MQLHLILAAASYSLMFVGTSDAKTLFEKHYKRTGFGLVGDDDSAAATQICPEGKTKCPTSTRCIRTAFFCDGDNDCHDNSDEDEHICANVTRTCPERQTKCPNSNRCQPTRYFCDGENDCGDNSDEENCAPITCPEGQTKCPTTNRCKPSTFFCDGENDCGDNSDEANCAGSGPIRFQSEFACLRQFFRTSNVCVQQLTTSLFGSMPSDPIQVFQTLKKMDVEDICRPLLEWDDCMAPMDSLCEYERFKDMQQEYTKIRTMFKYVCVEEIDALQSNKQCLVRESTNSGMPDIAMGTMMSCGRLLQSLESQSSPCPSGELKQCVKNAVVQQCGDGAGNLLERLVDRFSQLGGCQKRSVKSLSVMKKKNKKRSGILSFNDLMRSFL